MNIQARIPYLIALLITLICGLLSRADFLNPAAFVILYVGDALWALMVYWLICIIKPESDLRSQILVAILFSFAIECSQLYQAEWINLLRQTRLGGLILGFGFKITDLIAYTVGVALGALLNHICIRKQFADIHD